MTRLTINIEWDGPFGIKDLKKFNSDNDHGFYQIYGSHPVYGSDILLYIGRASVQTFGISIFQEGWGHHNNEYGLQVHLGRLLTDKPLEKSQRQKRIEQVFKLLVYFHSPAYNATHINNVHEDEQVRGYHILNWKSHRDLLPEISGVTMGIRIWNRRGALCVERFFLDEKYRYIL